MARVSWAEMLGIDLEVLRTESPSHPKQVAFRNEWEAKAKAFHETVSERERREFARRLVEEVELAEAFKLLQTRG